MKYLLSTSLLVFFLAFNGMAQTPAAPATAPAAAPAAAPADPNGAKIEFESETVDYGTIQQYADGIRHFKFKNTGKKDLIITSCTGSCGCTVPTCPKEVVKPGKSGEVEVKYATERIGQFTKNVTVVSNADRSPIVLTIKGNVLKKEGGDATTPGGAPAPAPTTTTPPKK